MITVVQVVEEYNNRKSNVKYTRYGVLTPDCEISIYIDVVNVHEKKYNDFNTLEFDAFCVVNKKYKHVKIVGNAVIIEQFIE